MSWKLTLCSHRSKNGEMGGYTEGASVCVSKAKPPSLLCGEGCNGWLFCTEAWRSIS